MPFASDVRLISSPVEAALALYRGDFLEGEPVGDWSLEVHDHLRRLYVDGLSALAERQMEIGDHAAAVSTLEKLVAREDLRENAYRNLAVCLTVRGERDRALHLLARLESRLRKELDAELEPETLDLIEALRRGAPIQPPVVTVQRGRSSE